MRAYRAIGYVTALLGIGLIWTGLPGSVLQLVGVLAAITGTIIVQVARDE